MCILVVTKNILLGDVLEKLLANVFFSDTSPILRLHVDDLSARIYHYQADVLVLEDGLLGELSLWSPKKLCNGRIPIILVHPNHNQVQVCGQFPIMLTQIADFTALFESLLPVQHFLSGKPTTDREINR